MTKGKVLLVCYYFPPLGLGGVTRPLNLFKYLPQFGYECHILTVKPVAYRKYEPELLEGLDKRKIHRAGSFDPQRLMYLLGIREVNPKTIAKSARFGESIFPDSKKGWVRPAVQLGMELYREFGYKAIISTSPPVSSHLVGMRLAEKTGAPWVADFRDMWTSFDIAKTYSDPKLVKKGEQLLGEIRAKSARRVAVDEPIGKYIGSIRVITNGFDPVVAEGWTKSPAKNQCKIGLLGSFSTRLPIEPLLMAIDRVRTENPELLAKVHIEQVGEVDREWLTSELRRYGMENLCQGHGLLSRRESVERLAECAVMYVGVSKEAAGLTTSRIYDLLASGRPLLAYAPPESEIAQLLEGYERACLFEDSSLGLAVEWLKKQIAMHTDGKLNTERLPYADRFAWDRLAGEMASVLDEVI